MHTDDEIKQTTTRMEELWDKLAPLWPAVKKNPEVANKIAELWSYLKSAENEHLVLPNDIEEFINYSTPNTPALSSSSYTNDTPESSNEIVSPSSINTSTRTEEIDKLIAEILGDSYRVDTTPEFRQTEKVETITNTTTTTTKSYITGSKELDDLVVAILGEGWETEDETSATKHFTPDSTQIETSNEWQGNQKEQTIENAGDDFNLDALVESILTDAETESHVQPMEAETPPAASTSIHMPDMTSDKTASAYIPAIIELTEPTQVPDLKSDIPDAVTASYVMPETDHVLETDTADETLNELISQVLNRESGTVTESGIKETTTDRISDLDDLVNEILNTKDEQLPISDFTDTAESGTINHTTDDRPSSSETETSEVTPIRIKPRIPVTPLPQSTPSISQKPEEMHHVESNSNLALASLLALGLLFVVIGSWQYFIADDDIKTAKLDADKKIINTAAMNKRKPLPKEPAPAVMETAPIIPSRLIKTPESQAIYVPQPEEQYNYSRDESIGPNNEYDARIEQDENEITIIINEPIEEAPFYSDAPYTKETDEHTVDNAETPDGKTADEDKPGIESPMKEKTKPKTNSKATREIIVHTVVKGDTLWAIAERYIDNPYRYAELAKLSKIKNPNLIYPGNKVRIIKYTK